MGNLTLEDAKANSWAVTPLELWGITLLLIPCTKESRGSPQTVDFKYISGESPGGPVVRTWRFHCHGPGSIPGRGTNVLQAGSFLSFEKNISNDNIKE